MGGCPGSAPVPHQAFPSGRVRQQPGPSPEDIPPPPSSHLPVGCSAHSQWGRISSSEPLGNQLSPPSTFPASRPHICPLALFFPRNSQNTLFEHYVGSFYTLLKILPGFPLMRRQEGGTSPHPVVSALSVTRSHPEPPCVTVTRGSLLPVLILLGGLLSAGASAQETFRVHLSSTNLSSLSVSHLSIFTSQRPLDPLSSTLAPSQNSVFSL